jgi:hypothetical protein
VIPSVSGRAVTELASILDGGAQPPLTILVDVKPYPDVNLLAKHQPK